MLSKNQSSDEYPPSTAKVESTSIMATDAGSVLSSDTQYGQKRKELLALVKNLRASGAQADLDLPRIAVIGNQSAGKSSLVEAISGITVPRDAGTCTRCPMECRMASSSGPWVCQIMIRWEFDDINGTRRDKAEEVPFGGAISSKGEVELMLRRAQAAVLFPNIASKKLLKMSLDDLHELSKSPQLKPLSFSRNAVCIDLSGSELTDLSFVDLPGIIQNASPEIVQLVEDLVLSHIKGNCLILVTLPMSDDIDNQKAARLARDVDPAGTRTIGVLTKPDTLPPGSVKLRELWLEVLEGRSVSNHLVHGYFCTRQPDDAERAGGITAAQARAAEMDFFAKTSPWNKSPHKNRFGTTRLVETLSTLLVERINETLPNLQREVASQLLDCNKELSVLPPAITGEPSTHVLNLVTDFCKDVRDHVHGTTMTARLVQTNRQTYAAFKRGIRSTAPRFIPYPSARESVSNVLAYLQIDMEDDDDDESAGADANTGPPGQGMYLNDVKKCITASVTRELPNNVPYPVKVHLILAFQRTWQLHSTNCFERVYAAFDKTLAVLMESKFKRYGSLHSRIRIAVQELLKLHKETTLAQLTTLLTLESTPFTQNSHYLAEKTAKSLALYKEARAGKTPPTPISARATPSGSRFPNLPALPYRPPPAQTPSIGESAFSFVSPSASNTAASPSASHVSSAQIGADEAKPRPATPKPAEKATPKPAETATPAVTVQHTSSSPFGHIVQPPVTQPTSNAFAASQSNRAFARGAFATPQGSSAFAAPQTGSAFAATQSTNAFAPPQNSFAVAAQAEERQKNEQEALAALAKLGYNVTAADLGKLNPPDIFEEELQVMAEVRAYFHVSYKRVIDYIPLAIDHQFLFGFTTALQQCLIEKLGLGAAKAAERCAAYLSEEPNIVAIRRELLAKKERLESVRTELDNFGL